MLSARKTRHLTIRTTTTKTLKSRNYYDFGQCKEVKAHLKSGPYLLVEVYIRDIDVESVCSLLALIPAGWY